MPLTAELKVHFLYLYQMALSDSLIDIKELEALYRIGEARGISRTEIDALLTHSGQAAFPIPGTVLEKIDCLYDLSLIAWADGTVEPGEKKMIAHLCSQFGFQEENIPGICEFLLDAASRNTPKEQILSTVSQNL